MELKRRINVENRNYHKFLKRLAHLGLLFTQYS